MVNGQLRWLVFSLLILVSFMPTNLNAKETSLLKEFKQKVPLAKKHPHKSIHHDITITDDWFWLRDSSYPKIDDKNILDYLKDENKYFELFKNQNAQLINKIFEEFKGRIDDKETSVPFVNNGFEYRWEFKEGDDYPTRYRKNLDTGKESIFLDEPKLAKNSEYFVISDWQISPNNQYLAYSVDISGDERYEIRIKDLTTGRLLDDVILNSNGAVNFTSDSKNVLYGLLDQEKWKTNSINVHTLGTINSQDKLLIAEPDDSFFLEFNLTRDGQFFVLSSSKGSVDEVHIVPSDLSTNPILMASRKQKIKYAVSHAHEKFYILTNDTHVNFRIAITSDKKPNYKHWKPFKQANDANYLRSISTFDQFIIIKQNVNGLEQLIISDYQGKQTSIDFPETLYTASLFNNPEFEQKNIRINYESMITPDTVFDYNVATKKFSTKKVKKIPSGYDKSQYETVRIMADARDGVKVPVSLMYMKGTKLDGSNPLHLYGYGAYASGISPRFSTSRLSYIDRGVIYAIAHVRGGNEMGYQWYLDGKLDKRTNTFNDFVDVAKHLVKHQYTSVGNISISGRSAGGELMGAVVIQQPELWSSVNLGVPFVDVLNTMLSADLPLTPPEWVEWGNPIKNKADFELIRSYSPYDNITAKNYPPMFVSGGLNDPRVTYWEPAKWTAKMRHLKIDDNLLIMRINMGAGHFSNSGRYGRLKDYAEEYAFTLLSHGIEE